MRYKIIAFYSLCGVVLWQMLSLVPVKAPSNYSYGSFIVNDTGHVDSVAASVDSAAAQSQVAQYSGIVFVGDILLARHVETLMYRHGATYPFAGLAVNELLSKAAVVGNFESSMASIHRQTPSFVTSFSTAPEFFDVLATEGYTHLSLANNHSLDYGQPGYERTKHAIETSDMVAFGHGSSVDEHSVTYLNTQQGTIALIGIHATLTLPDQEAIASVLRHASTMSVRQIAYVHWGNEYEPLHSRAQERLATQLIAEGVDLIIGHHPHVVQDIDVIDGVVVMYSLGNYIFDQYFSKQVKEGLVATLVLHDTPELRLLPVQSDRSLAQPTSMSDLERTVFLDALARRSHPLLRSDIERGVVPLLNFVATSTEMAIMMQ